MREAAAYPDEAGWVTDYRDPFDGPALVKPCRFELVPFSEIVVGSTAVYLVKGLIPRVGLTVLYGPPKCAKTFWLFDVLMHVALGWDYRGRRVKQGAVVYCAFEGANGFKARVEAFRRDRLVGFDDDVPFHLVAARMSFAKDHSDLIASVRSHLGDERPAAIVLDTLKRSLAGSENDDKDMGAYVEAADAVREAFECAVIIVHHSGLESGRPRGSTSLPGAADAQLACEKSETGVVNVEVQLMKDGPEGDCVASRLREVEVGVDEDGDPITSLVVDEAEASFAKLGQAERLTHGARIALTALAEAIDEHGAPPPSSPQIPPMVRCVTEEQWRTFAYKRGISSSAEPRARQQAFTRAGEALRAKHKVGTWDGFVWPI